MDGTEGLVRGSPATVPIIPRAQPWIRELELGKDYDARGWSPAPAVGPDLVDFLIVTLPRLRVLRIENQIIADCGTARGRHKRERDVPRFLKFNVPPFHLQNPPYSSCNRGLCQALSPVATRAPSNPLWPNKARI